MQDGFLHVFLYDRLGPACDIFPKKQFWGYATKNDGGLALDLENRVHVVTYSLLL